MKSCLWVCKSVYIKEKEGKGMLLFFFNDSVVVFVSRTLSEISGFWFKKEETTRLSATILGRLLRAGAALWPPDRQNGCLPPPHPTPPIPSSPPSLPQHLVLRLRLLSARAPPSVPDKQALCQLPSNQPWVRRRKVR